MIRMSRHANSSPMLLAYQFFNISTTFGEREFSFLLARFYTQTLQKEGICNGRLNLLRHSRRTTTGSTNYHAIESKKWPVVLQWRVGTN